MSGRIHAWQLNSSSTCSVYTVMWCFYPLLGALRHWSYTVWRAEEHARLIFHFLGGCKTVASNIYFHVCACIWEIVSFANHQVQKSQGSEFHKHVSRKEISHKKQRFYRRFWCFVYSLWGCKEWSCWIAWFRNIFMLQLGFANAYTCLLDMCHVSLAWSGEWNAADEGDENFLCCVMVSVGIRSVSFYLH